MTADPPIESHAPRRLQCCLFKVINNEKNEMRSLVYVVLHEGVNILELAVSNIPIKKCLKKDFTPKTKSA